MAASDADLLIAPLRYLVAVADEGSFTAAARALHVSQPSLSVAVRKLEEAVGAKLLHRDRRGARPTPAGELLLDAVRHADRALAGALDEIHALAESPRGRLTLGAHESLAAYFLPGFMARFLAGHPQVELSLQNGNSRDVEAAVVARRIDAGLVVNPEGHLDCVVTELFADRVGFVVNAALRRRARNTGSERLLAEVPLIHVPELRQTQFLLGALTQRSVSTGSALACSSMELVKSLVLDGVGVGVLPYRVASHGVTAGRLLRLSDALPVFDDRITLVRRADLPMSAAARALLDGILEHARTMPSLDELLAAR